MRYSNILAAVIFAASPFTAVAEDGFLSIPASEFSGNDVAYNDSGTTTFIRTAAFAPILLPDDATITFFGCGGRAAFRKEVIFTLRRNAPQQANIDMAVLQTGLDETGFVFLNTNEVVQGEVDNKLFNYFIVAEASKPDAVQPNSRAICIPTQNGVDLKSTECSVGFCRVGYTDSPLGIVGAEE